LVLEIIAHRRNNSNLACTSNTGIMEVEVKVEVKVEVEVEVEVKVEEIWKLKLLLPR
jgi:ribosomal protein L9